MSFRLWVRPVVPGLSVSGDGAGSAMLPVSIDAHGRLTNENDVGVRGAHLCKISKGGATSCSQLYRKSNLGQPPFSDCLLERSRMARRVGHAVEFSGR